MSRSDLPHFFKNDNIILKKHLSIIVFKLNVLLKYSKLKNELF